MFKNKILVLAEIWANTATELTNAQHTLQHNHILDIIKAVREGNVRSTRTPLKHSKQQRADAPPPHALSIMLYVDQHELRGEEHNWATRLAHSLRSSGIECDMSYPRRSSQEWARFDLRKHSHHTR